MKQRTSAEQIGVLILIGETRNGACHLTSVINSFFSFYFLMIAPSVFLASHILKIELIARLIQENT